MGADIVDVQVLGVELPGCGRSIQLVVGYAAVAHDERVDAQIERRLTGSILRGQRVEHELEVGRSVGRGARQPEMSAKQLG